jgi:histidinol-phosphate aminotransferase
MSESDVEAMMDRKEQYDGVAHGALDYAELERLQMPVDEVIDFSVNANPYGPSPQVREAVARVALDRYPDRACLQLRRQLLIHELVTHDLVLDNLVCGNGASELIWTISRAFLHVGDRAAVIGPTFGEYEAASRMAGALVSEWRGQEDHCFAPQVQSLLDWLQRVRPRLVWLCNPNNPTGTYLVLADVAQLARQCAELNARLVVDESYIRFLVREQESAAALLTADVCEHVIVLRSLTKDFALAGVRLGYVVGTLENVARVRAYLPSWNVSALAQAAGCATVPDRAHLLMTLTRLKEEREVFFAALRQTELPVIASETHFCLLKVEDAHLVRQRLLLRRMLVRDCTSFGLRAYIRVATRPAEDWHRLVDVLPEVVQ